jgi:putative peptidoglycan binding protein
MKGFTAPIVGGVAVLYVLVVLLSADRTASGLASVNNQGKIADLGSRLIETAMLQRYQQHSGDQSEITNADRTMKVQQALKENGFYSGPVDGVMRKKTQEAIQSFQQSKQLNVTGTIDDETIRELRIR